MNPFRRDPFWARDGLTFACTRCGHCCRRPGYVQVTESEGEAIAQALHGPTARAADLSPRVWSSAGDGAWEIEVVEGGAGCPLLRPDGTCSVEAVKPAQCATYPFWPEVVRNERTWRAEGRECEGIGQGARFAPEQIRALLAGCGRTSTSDGSAVPAGPDDETRER